MSRARRIAELVELLRSLGHDAALVGGVAVSIRARERFTRDVDLAVAVASDAEVEALAIALQRVGYSLEMVVEQEATGRIGTLRFVAPGSGERLPNTDLLFASCGIEPEIVAEADTLRIEAGVSVPIARIHHLIAMKVLAMREGRDQDVADLRALLAVASEADLAGAESALALIAGRGFHRGKDLLGELRKLVGS